jgi:amidophosphoribosyltransferase
MGVEDIRASLGADSLGYISLDGMVGATNQPRERLCTACFTGSYPIDLPDSAFLGKHSLEQPELPLEGVNAPVPRQIDVSTPVPRV